MGKGGGGGGSQPQQPTSVSTSTSGLPDYVEPFFTDLLERAESVSTEDYIPIPTQRIAGFDPLQTESFDTAAAVARSGVPEELGAARARYQQAMDFQPGYTPGVAQGGDFTASGVAQQYMNPFIENVIDVQQDRARRQFAEETDPRIADQAVRAGAFGGSREGIARGLARARLDDRLGDLEATQRAQAFEQAQKSFDADQLRGLRAFGLTEEAGQQGARLGLAGEQVGLSAAARAAALGEGEQALELRQADVLRQIGEQQQAFDQQQLDISTSDFISERDFPRQQIAYMGGVLHGVPVSPVSESSVFQAQPSSAQQMLGFGLGGLGLAKSIFS